MIEKWAGSGLGRAYAALTFWYVMACCLPTFLTVLLKQPAEGSTPGYTYVNSRLEECAGKFGCPTEPADIGAVARQMALILAPTLLVSVPLCAYLARKWQMPGLAGFVAAVTGWLVFCVGGLWYLSA